MLSAKLWEVLEPLGLVSGCQVPGYAIWQSGWSRYHSTPSHYSVLELRLPE